MDNTPSYLEAPMSFIFYWLFLIGGTIALLGMGLSCLIYMFYLLTNNDKE